MCANSFVNLGHGLDVTLIWDNYKSTRTKNIA